MFSAGSSKGGIACPRPGQGSGWNRYPGDLLGDQDQHVASTASRPSSRPFSVLWSVMITKSTPASAAWPAICSTVAAVGIGAACVWSRDTYTPACSFPCELSLQCARPDAGLHRGQSLPAAARPLCTAAHRYPSLCDERHAPCAVRRRLSIFSGRYKSEGTNAEPPTRCQRSGALSAITPDTIRCTRYAFRYRTHRC